MPPAHSSTPQNTAILQHEFAGHMVQQYRSREGCIGSWYPGGARESRSEDSFSWDDKSQAGNIPMYAPRLQAQYRKGGKGGPCVQCWAFAV